MTQTRASTLATVAIQHKVIPRPLPKEFKKLSSRATPYVRLWSIMRITSRNLRKMAPEFLDTDKPIRQQAQDHWASFVENAHKAQYDLLKHYEGDWPVEAYMTRYLSNRLTVILMEKETMEGKRNQSVTKAKSTVSAPSPNQPLRSDQLNSSLTVPTPRVSASGTVAHSRSRTPFPTPTPTTSAPTPSPLAVSTYSPLTRNGNSDDSGLSYFLGSLQPDITHILPVLKEIGITDGKDVEALKLWPSGRRREFLSYHLGGKLSPFELATLELGTTGELGLGMASSLSPNSNDKIITTEVMSSSLKSGHTIHIPTDSSGTSPNFEN
ncbi:hypothetical protein SERLA73DRAFT_156793 [Serpula lacrymans var. lacrymans S7.3]|uniref:Uncharacterized protein n=1 Tax=Serpula lacrymans var. lacrymans (strain S7.3) TaxID=936435 RepID=F8QG02_SERL3|nr:hypothetical protein SERLA73DRAFT_156793 [Serpula lacrymans var. lacrymans S7.3]